MGRAVRVKVRVPGVLPASPQHELRQPEYDSVDQEGNLVFVVEFSYKATLFIVAIFAFMVYTLLDPLLKAFGFVHG
jgi:hypothetical protein